MSTSSKTKKKKKKKKKKRAMLFAFLACLLVVSLYVIPYYLLPFPAALRGHRDAPRTIRARALCSFGSCAAVSAVLLAVVAARLRFDNDGDVDGGENGGSRRHRHRHLVEARLALSDPFAWLRASFPLWAVRKLAPALAEAVAGSLGAGKGAASAWRTAAEEAAEEGAARLGMAATSGSFSSSSSSSFVPSPAAATLRLLGLSPLSAAAPGAMVGVVSVCCLLAWPLSQRSAELLLAFGGGAGGEREEEGKWRQRRRWWRKKRDDDNAAAEPSPSFFSAFLPSATMLRDLVIAPLTEEIAFRGCLLPILLLLIPPSKGATSATKTTTAALVASSAAFASAHLHHAAAALLLSPNSLPRDQRRALALGALLQLLYTFAFGAAAGALLLASGSLAAPVAAHSLANLLGLPRRRPKKNGGSSSSPPELLRRAEAAIGVLGVAAFALMAAGCSLGGRGRGEKGIGVGGVGGGVGFAPFSGLASSLGAAGHGRRYRSLAAALSLPA